MNNLPGHSLPQYSEASREDALFHYTTADGLLGILQSGQIWSTAYYCTNDQAELAEGRGVLGPIFSEITHDMILSEHDLVTIFTNRGVDIRDYAKGFEDTIVSFALNVLCAYITCFCKPVGKEDFSHGLLSQWRGYGSDGGYALQFSKKKLLAAIGKAKESKDINYELQDVHYTVDNPLRAELLEHKDAFLGAYDERLKMLSQPLQDLLKQKTLQSPIKSLTGGPLESLLDYLIQTKNLHFAEENECRLSYIDVVSPENKSLPVSFFNRSGLVVPFVKSPAVCFPLLESIEWIVIGPCSNVSARFESVRQLVRALGLDIKVRPSHIPFVRF